MPNFGRLTDDLFCGTLTVGDVMVLDAQLNLIVGNITAKNIHGILFTSRIVEENSMAGITVAGNLHIQDGSFLTGNVNLDGVTLQDMHALGSIHVGQNAFIAGELFVDTMTSQTQPGTVGPTLIGNVAVGGSLTASDRVVAEVVCASLGLFDILGGKGADQIDVAANLVVATGFSIAANAITANTITTNNTLTIMGNMSIAGDVGIAGDLAVAGNVSSENFAVVQDLIVGDDLTVNGNLTLYGTSQLSGNVTVDTLRATDLYVHTVHGFSPINFASPVQTPNSITLTGLLNFLQTSFGAKIMCMDGGDAEIHGGNLMVTPVGAVGQPGGHVMMHGGDCRVHGGNIMVTPTGGIAGGKIQVMDGGQVHIMGNATMQVGDTTNQMITVDSGNIRVQGDLNQSALMFHDQLGVPRAFLTGEVLSAVRIAATPDSNPVYLDPTTTAPIPWTTALDNTNGVSFNAGTGVFTAPRDNYYAFTVSGCPLVISSTTGLAEFNIVIVFPVNGAPFTPQLYAQNYVQAGGGFIGFVPLSAATTAFLFAGQSVQPLVSFGSSPAAFGQLLLRSGTDYMTITELARTKV